MLNNVVDVSLSSSSAIRPSSETHVSPLNQKPQVAFISGHIEVDNDYFEEHYVPKIQTAISKGHHFVVGPAEGIDTIALYYLLNTAKVDPQMITVYFAEFQKRDMAEVKEQLLQDGYSVNMKVEGSTTGVRDEAMTRDSDYDILRFMTDDEQRALYGQRYYPRISNTEKNYRRRHGLPLHDNAAFAASQSVHGVVGGQLAEFQMANPSPAVAMKKLKNKLFANWFK